MSTCRGTRAVAYVRVSLERPGMISPEVQLVAIRAHCRREGYEIVEEIADIDHSGQHWEGRQIERAVLMLEFGAADVLVVSRWSRLSRNRVDWVLAIERIERVGGRVESASEPVDSTTSAGRFTRNIFAEHAAFESERQADYCREMHKRRVREGLPPDGFDRFGYRKVGSEYVPDPIMGKVLASMYRRYIAGCSFQAITVWLHQQQHTAMPGGNRRAGTLASASAVRAVLDHGFGAGLIWAYGDHSPGRHRAVISLVQWQRYQEARRSRQHRVATTTDRTTYEFEDLVRCGVCGDAAMRAMTTATERDGVVLTYRCPTESGSRLYRGRCNTTVRASVIEAAVLLWLRSIVADPAAAIRLQLDTFARCERYREQRRAREVALSGTPADADAELLSELDRLTRLSSYDDPRRACQELLEDWACLDAQFRRARVARLIGRIVIGRGRGATERVGKIPVGRVSIEPV